MENVKHELDAVRARLERVEGQLRLLFRKLGISTQEAPAVPPSPAVMDLLRRGDRKGAMRAFMEETGASLKDAQTFIESLMAGPTE